MQLHNQSRRSFMTAAAAAGAAFSFPALSRAAMANDTVRMGFISCGSRANGLMGAFTGAQGVEVTALCDPDESRVGKAKSRFPKAKGYGDLRKLIEDDNVDAVVVATCNHWHCLAAIWAMQAGKDVYVEKPLVPQPVGRSIRRSLPPRSTTKICQVGTQQRSDPMQAEIKKFLHEEQGPGRDPRSARVNRYGVREPDRQAVNTAEDRQERALRLLVGTCGGQADLSRQAALRLALGLEHGLR
jgi:predicted dehydrogenase